MYLGPLGLCLTVYAAYSIYCLVRPDAVSVALLDQQHSRLPISHT